MNIIKDYVAYLKDNKEGYWFKRKLYGWGWTPARKEGWATVGIYVLLVIVVLARAPEVMDFTTAKAQVIAPVLILTLLLLLICYLKGETPRWQWGKERSK
jgi:predicted Na+-dependent transporter